MKKIVICSMILLAFATAFCQDSLPQPGTRDYYLRKSHNQKSAARTLLIAGPVLIGTGFLIGDRKESSFDDAAMGAFVGGLGVLSCIGSIPLFLASSRNSERARTMSVNFKLERSTNAKGFQLKERPLPSLALKVSL